jgi:hypothetical protein
MDDAGVVRRRQPGPGGDEQPDHRAPRPRRRQPGPDAVAIDQLHGQEDLAAVLADLVDRDHVGMGQLGQRPRLAPDQLAGLGAAPLRRGTDAQQLDRHRPVQLWIPGPVDRAHATLSEHLDHLEAADPLGHRGGSATLRHQRVFGLGGDRSQGVGSQRVAAGVRRPVRDGVRRLDADQRGDDLPAGRAAVEMPLDRGPRLVRK